MELKINLVDLVKKEGVALKKSGKTHFGRCPFHDDKNPSFVVCPGAGRFVCFGCGEKGDAIDFIRKLRGITFKEALGYLGIDKSSAASQEGTKERKRRKLVAAFRKWERTYYNELATDYRATHTLMASVETINQVEELALLYHQIPILEYYMDILAEGSEQEKFLLFKEQI